MKSRPQPASEAMYVPFPSQPESFSAVPDIYIRDKSKLLTTQTQVDVRDLAHAHILTLATPAVHNQRFLIGGHPYSSQLAVDCLKNIPELAGRLPKDNDEVPPHVQMGDVESWNAKLGIKLRTPQETFGDAARRMLELERQFGGK